MKTILFLAMGLSALSGLSALNVDQAVQQALGHNLGLQTEDLKLAQKADEKTYSFNRLYPSISTNATVLRLNNLNVTQYAGLWEGVFRTLSAQHSATYVPSSAYTSQLTEDNNWNVALGLTVQVAWSPAVFRGIVQTLVDYDNAVLSRQAAAARLDRDVRKAFYGILALHEATTVLESQLKVAEDRYRLAKLNFEAGLGSEIAMLQAQVALENRRPPLADQRLNEENARAGFRILLNLPDGAPLSLEGDLSIAAADMAAVGALDGAALAQDRTRKRWDVTTLEGTARSLDNLATLQADSLLPALVMGYSMDPTANAPFKDDRWKTWSNYVQTSGNFMVGLGWKLDGLLPGSTTGLSVANLRRQAEQTQLGVEQTVRAGENEIRSLVGKAKKSVTSLEGLNLALSLAERSAKLTEAGFQAGTQSFNEAQDADLQLQTARLQLLNEELTLTSTLADLDYALAAHRGDWLKAVAHG